VGNPYDHNKTTVAKQLEALLLQEPMRQFLYEIPDAFTTGAGGLRAYNRFRTSFRILEVHLSVSAAVAGSAVIVDVNVNGTTIFTTQANRPQIAVGAEEGASTTIDGPAFEPGDYFTVDVDQGSGSDLAVCILVG
jgi:hypothetical protein